MANTRAQKTAQNLSTLTTAGDIAYASAAGTPARLGIGSTSQVLTVAAGVPSWATAAGGVTYVGCSLRNSVGQSTSNATQTLLTWDTEKFDTDSIHSTSSNTGRVTVPSGKAGKWRISGGINHPAYGSGMGINIFVYVNGAYFQTGFPQFADFANSGTSTMMAAMNLELLLAVGDYVELYGEQNSGGTADIRTQYSNFQFSYIGA